MGRKKEDKQDKPEKAGSLLKSRVISLIFENGGLHAVYIILVLLLVAAVIFLLLAPGLAREAGVGVGSFKGVTIGLGAGAKDGKEEGLSAKDITMCIGTKMESTAKLEVLLVSLKMSDVYEQGDYYAALFSTECEAVFTVDLGRSTAKLNEEGQIEICIPEPVVEIYIDDASVKILDEYKKDSLFDGSSEDGYTGYLHSREKLKEKAEEKLEQNTGLLDQARTVAKKQAEALAKSVSGSNMPIIVKFIDEGGVIHGER